MSRKKTVPPTKAFVAKSNAAVKTIWYKNPLYAALLLALIAFGLYFNSIFNEYVLDDIISITGNAFTKKGLGGIPDLINKDSFYGFIGNASELSGGRWRPLALITFAVEWEFFPNSPHLSHFVNVLLYAFTAFALFYFVYRFAFKDNIGASFATTFLFVIHPIHTEVVANIKSRDELLSFLLLVGSLWFLMRHCFEKEKLWLLVVSLTCYFLAMLSKENGLTFIAIVPLTLFVFARYDVRKSILKALPFVGVAVLYFLLRVAVIGFVQKKGGIDEIMNAPYLYASATQALSTKLYVLGMYIKLLFFPHPLSYDYSYNQIQYVDFSNALVWFVVLIQLALLVFAFWKLRERSVLAYGILFYFFSIFIVSNLIIDIGGTLGERFLYQPSFGFCLAVVSLALFLFNKLQLDEQKQIGGSVALLVLLFIPAALTTYARNEDWKNDKTLFVADVYKVPNSARAQNGSGTSFILLSDDAKPDSLRQHALLDSAILHLRRAMKIHPRYTDPYLNIGTAYNRLGNVDSMEASWNAARERNRTHPKLKEYDGVLSTMMLHEGLRKGNVKDYNNALVYLRKSVKYNPNNYDGWYNLGGVYFTVQKVDSAAIAFQRCLKLKPDHIEAQKGLNAAAGILIREGKLKAGEPIR